ncbi:MAG: D-lactate dehydrogenase [Pseudomonadota bacterium]
MGETALLDDLRALCGRRYVHTSQAALARFRKGWRSGEGEAEAAVEVGSLLEMWRVLQACVRHDRIVIMQAANTGLTEGSTPSGTYDRPVVIINTLRLKSVHLLRGGTQIISEPGATLYGLEKQLAPLGREPHSVIGATCIGASIMGGVCNNSGGALVRRGPAYTELSLFAQKLHTGELVLVNHLGIDLGRTPEEILGRLDRSEISDADLVDTGERASDNAYPDRVRDVDAATPARFNADPRTLHEASGCAGKLAVFAVQLDTFPIEPDERTYYIGTHSTHTLTDLRRTLLTKLDPLPISAEYLHRDTFDITRDYGKDTLLLIHWLGTDRLPFIFKAKARIDALLEKLTFLPSHGVDRLLQFFSRLLPEALPKRMLAWRATYDHHLILKVSGSTAHQTEAILTDCVGKDGWFACTPREAKLAGLHRFAAAGAAARYGIVNEREVEAILPLDIALRRNDRDWFETLPPAIEQDIVAKLYYGHFLCHVFHQDYAIRKGADPALVKARMLALLDDRGAEYPAEHNVGHLYEAKPALIANYERLDPTNSFNPGIGKTSKQKRIARQPSSS